MTNTVLEQVVANSKNDLILFFVLVVVVVVAIALPLYKATAKSSKEKLELSFKREQLMMKVVSDNSTVISKLTTLIEGNNQNCADCKLEQTTMTHSIMAKQEEILSRVDTAFAVVLDRKEVNRYE